MLDLHLDSFIFSSHKGKILKWLFLSYNAMLQKSSMIP